MTAVHVRAILRGVAIAISVVLGISALAQQMPSMSKEFAYGTYVDRAGRVQILVGTVLAGIDAEQAFIPFQIAVGVWGDGPELTIAIENFELSDSNGQVYQAAEPKDVAKSGMNQMVKNWNQMTPLNTGNLFVNSKGTVSDLYTLESIAETQTHLDRNTHLRDVIYFPRPEHGLDGEMILSFYTAGMKEGAVNIRFKVAAMKKKHQKQAKKAKKGAAS